MEDQICLISTLSKHALAPITIPVVHSFYSLVWTSVLCLLVFVDSYNITIY